MLRPLGSSRKMLKEKYLQGNLTLSIPLAPGEKAN